MSPTLNVNPTLFVTPCNFLGEFIDLQCCNYCHLPSDFLSKFQSSMTIFHYKLVTREGRVSTNGWNSSITHDNICKLIPKKCPPKSYHMSLNTIFSIAQKGCLVTITHVVVMSQLSKGDSTTSTYPKKKKEFNPARTLAQNASLTIFFGVQWV